MDIIVCVKHVPDVAEAEVQIDEGGKDIKKAGLLFDINEWDRYAIEEAILLKERFGGCVTVISMGEEAASETLRRCLAMGADEAIRLTDKAFEGSDGYVTAKILSQAIEKLKFDLILTGAQADDDGYAQVGVALAELLGIPHAALVTNVEVQDRFLRTHRELEGDLEEVVRIELPAALTIQSGINEPRYVSIMGIRRVAKREIKVWGIEELGLKEEEVGGFGSKIKVEEMFLPPSGGEAEILKGNPEELSERFQEILRKKGGLI